MNNKRIYLSPPHMSGEELDFVHEAFSSNWIAPVGPHVDAFEKEFCQTTGAAHAAAVSSGTAALHLAMITILAGVHGGDEVSCFRPLLSREAPFPLFTGAPRPSFIDCEERSWNMDPQLLEDAIKNRPQKGKKIKAAIVVHLYGQSAEGLGPSWTYAAVTTSPLSRTPRNLSALPIMGNSPAPGVHRRFFVQRQQDRDDIGRRHDSLRRQGNRGEGAISGHAGARPGAALRTFQHRLQLSPEQCSRGNRPGPVACFTGKNRQKKGHFLPVFSQSVGNPRFCVHA